MAAILLAPHLAVLLGTAESFLQTSLGPSNDSSSVVGSNMPRICLFKYEIRLPIGQNVLVKMGDRTLPA